MRARPIVNVRSFRPILVCSVHRRNETFFLSSPECPESAAIRRDSTVTRFRQIRSRTAIAEIRARDRTRGPRSILFRCSSRPLALQGKTNPFPDRFTIRCAGQRAVQGGPRGRQTKAARVPLEGEAR